MDFVMDFITFRYLLGMAMYTILEMRLTDVVTTYVYGSLHANIYMKVPLGLETKSHAESIHDKHCGVKLQRALYDLKQSGYTWY